MPVHADAVPVIDSEEEYFNGTRRVEGPLVNALGVDLRLYKIEMILEGPSGQMDSA
jgi:hypothetical protein